MTGDSENEDVKKGTSEETSELNEPLTDEKENKLTQNDDLNIEDIKTEATDKSTEQNEPKKIKTKVRSTSKS